MPMTRNTWWHEQTVGSGITQALDMRRVYSARSEFQEIEVYQHSVYGRVLVLDGTVQLSQADEFIYHEMAVHVPLLGRLRQDVKVLIIGGGDGGILREALRHPWVASVVMVEIDPLVVEVSNTYIGVQGDYQDPRVKLHFADGVEYMAQAALECALLRKPSRVSGRRWRVCRFGYHDVGKRAGALVARPVRDQCLRHRRVVPLLCRRRELLY